MLKIPIPYIDLRGKTPIDLLRAYPDKARDLVKAARRMYGRFSYITSIAALPLADRLSHAWLENHRNPYLHEIESIADIIGVPGVYTLNMCYEWGCTSGAWRTGETVSLLRVLDWPFPDLGKHVVVALQGSKAGEYYNITWPGLSGVFTGMAPGRFSAAVNMAPMRRHGLGYAGDWVKNRLMANKASGTPPAHLMRQVFEKASSYREAREMLRDTPVTIPVTFTLAGIEQGEGCVIERLEDSAHVIELSAGQQVHATNHFNGPFAGQGKGWRLREFDSPGRYRQACDIGGHDIERDQFGWLQAPVLNVFTRLCVIGDAATGRLMVQGYEGSIPVTTLFNHPGVPYESREAI